MRTFGRQVESKTASRIFKLSLTKLRYHFKNTLTPEHRIITLLTVLSWL